MSNTWEKHCYIFKDFLENSYTRLVEEFGNRGIALDKTRMTLTYSGEVVVGNLLYTYFTYNLRERAILLKLMVDNDWFPPATPQGDPGYLLIENCIEELPTRAYINSRTERELAVFDSIDSISTYDLSMALYGFDIHDNNRTSIVARDVIISWSIRSNATMKSLFEALKKINREDILNALRMDNKYMAFPKISGVFECHLASETATSQLSSEPSPQRLPTPQPLAESVKEVDVHINKDMIPKVDLDSSISLGSLSVEQSQILDRPVTKTPYESGNCVLCLEKKYDTLFIECGHVACCWKCAQTLRVCPLCRKDIVKILKAFMA